MSEQHDNWLVTLGMPSESFDSRPEQGGDGSSTGGDEGSENTDRKRAGQEGGDDSQNPQQENGDSNQNTQQDQRDDAPDERTGPTVSAQSGDVQDALEAKDLWSDKGSRYGKLLNDANVPNGVNVTTTITVDQALNVHITVTTSPADKSGAALERLLNSKCDGPFKAAIMEYFNRKGLKVADTLTVKWLNW
jgi:hypothetical protein